VHKLERKIKDVERQKIYVDTEIEGLREDKKIKLNQLKSRKAAESQNAQQEEADLEAEIANKDAELARLEKLLRERKELLERTSSLQAASAQPVSLTIGPDVRAYQVASDLKYEQLSHEIRTIRVQLATMTEVQKSEMLFQKVTKGKPLIDHEQIRVRVELPSLDYTLEEMLAQV